MRPKKLGRIIMNQSPQRVVLLSAEKDTHAELFNRLTKLSDEHKILIVDTSNSGRVSTLFSASHSASHSSPANGFFQFMVDVLEPDPTKFTLPSLEQYVTRSHQKNIFLMSSNGTNQLLLHGLHEESNRRSWVKDGNKFKDLLLTLKHLLEVGGDNYSHIFITTSPDLNLLTQIAIVAATYVSITFFFIHHSSDMWTLYAKMNSTLNAPSNGSMESPTFPTTCLASNSTNNVLIWTLNSQRC
jgi:hypothetical protein